MTYAENPHDRGPARAYGVGVEATESDAFSRLARAGLEVGRALDLDETLQAIVHAAREVTGARYSALGVLGDDRRITRFVTSGMSGLEVAAIGAPPSGRGILGVVIDEDRPIRIRDIATDPRAAGFPPSHPPMHSFLGVPVRAHGEVFGNLYLTEAPAGEFSDDDQSALLLLAERAGYAVENARLYEQAVERAAEAQRAASARASIASIAAQILRERDVSRVMRSLAREARGLVGARVVAIGVPDEISRTVRFPVAVGEGAELLRGREIPLDASLTGAVFSAGESMRLDDAPSSPVPDAATITDLQVTSVCSVPMKAGDETLAVLSCLDQVDGRAFTAADQEQLEGLASLGAVALQTARAFGRERARSEALARLRHAETEAEARRTSLVRVIKAQEDERRRIAHDLHDRTAGTLAAVQMHLKRLERERDPEALRDGLAEARRTVGEAIDDVRDLIVDLRPKVLDDFGLGPALERLGDSLARRSGVSVECATDDEVRTVRDELATTAYRIAQEAVTNITKHARATRVRISAAIDGGSLHLVIEDDGIGVDPDAAPSGYGLDGMRERAELVHGRIALTAPTGGGTRVQFEAPL
jgi:signal transduction histidine kinase